MLVGRGVDFNGDGENDVFLVGSHLPRSKEEAEARQAIGCLLIGGFAAYVVLFVVGSVIVGIIVGFTSPEMRQYWGSSDFYSDIKWAGLTVGGFGVLLLGRRILTTFVFVVSRAAAITKRTVMSSLVAPPPGMFPEIWVRRGQRIRGPVAVEDVMEALKLGQLKTDDLFAFKKEGPWKPLAKGLKQGLRR